MKLLFTHTSTRTQWCDQFGQISTPSGARSQVTALEGKGWKRLEGVTTETLLKPCGKLLSDTSGDSQLPSSTPSILEFPGQDVLRGLTARPQRGGDGLPPSGKRGPSTRWWSDLKLLQGFLTLPGTFRSCRAGGRARSCSDLKPGTTVVGGPAAPWSSERKSFGGCDVIRGGKNSFSPNPSPQLCGSKWRNHFASNLDSRYFGP